MSEPTNNQRLASLLLSPRRYETTLCLTEQEFKDLAECVNMHAGLVAACEKFTQGTDARWWTVNKMQESAELARAALAGNAKPATGQETPFQAMARICGEDNAPKPATTRKPKG